METAWRPENSTGDFHGPTRLREALVRSRNLVSIRLLRASGRRTRSTTSRRFGFDRASLPTNLTLALGTVQATPLEIATGYAVFANGGFRVQPYFIDRIENAAGRSVWRAAPRVACEACEQPRRAADLPPGSATPRRRVRKPMRCAAEPDICPRRASPNASSVRRTTTS